MLWPTLDFSYNMLAGVCSKFLKEVQQHASSSAVKPSSSSGIGTPAPHLKSVMYLEGRSLNHCP